MAGSAEMVHADPLRVRQIVRNLLTNAARYGGGRVRVVLETGPGHGALTVLDDGDGVPSDQAEMIFESYGRAHNAAGQPGSVGLGLSVSRNLARNMGGDLSYSRRDGWTGFELTLPLQHSPARAVAGS